MNASESALLQSSLALVKRQFQAVWDSGIDNRAFLIQQNKYAAGLGFDSSDIDWLFIKAGGYTSGFGKSHDLLNSDAEGRVIARETSSGASWRFAKPAPSFGFDRWHQVVGLSTVKVAAEAAGRILADLPENTQQKLWDALPEGESFSSTNGWTQWSEAIFTLAWKRNGKGIAGSPLKAERHTPVRFDKPDLRPLPDHDDWFSMRDWYSKLDNFAAASVQAIDILQSWLGDELKRVTEANGEPPETAETIQRRLQEIVKHCQEEHHLRVRLCMEAFPDLRTGLAKWEWDDHKGDCPEWQLANERLLKRFGAIDGEPARWGLRLRPPIMCVRWDEDAAIDLGRAIRDDLFDAARSAVADQPVMVATPTAPKGEGTPVEMTDEDKAIALARGEPNGKPAKGKRGRRKGSVASDPAFDQQVFERWAEGRGQFNSFEAVAISFGLNRDEAWAAKERHRDRLRGKSGKQGEPKGCQGQ